MTASTQRRIPPLREIRNGKRIGLRELARTIEVDPGYLSRIERGLVKPSLPVLYRIAEALGLSEFADDLAPYVEEGPSS